MASIKFILALYGIKYYYTESTSAVLFTFFFKKYIFIIKTICDEASNWCQQVIEIFYDISWKELWIERYSLKPLKPISTFGNPIKMIKFMKVFYIVTVALSDGLLKRGLLN